MDNTTEHEVQQDAKHLHLLLFMMNILMDVKIKKEQATPTCTIKILCRRYE